MRFVLPAMTSRPDDPRIPLASMIFGYGPMLPLVAAAVGCWVLGGGWPFLAIRLAVIWAALILSFIGGVRRGFGFGAERSTVRELVAAASYVAVAGLALVSPRADWAMALLAVGYLVAALFDRRAAVAGDAPLHFARLRPPQLLIGAAGLVGCWAWLIH